MLNLASCRVVVQATLVMAATGAACLLVARLTATQIPLPLEAVPTVEVSLNPEYKATPGGEICASQNLAGTQLAPYNCEGFPGSTCVLCQGITALSGRRIESGDGTVQPNSGPAESCANLSKWLGICNSNNGAYTCNPAVNTTETCAGSYQPYVDQTSGPPIAKSEGTTKTPVAIVRN